MITAAGVGSVIDVEGILSQLVEVERPAHRTLERARQRLDIELSAFGSVKSSMDELATAARSLGNTTRSGRHAADSSHTSVFAVPGNATAAPRLDGREESDPRSLGELRDAVNRTPGNDTVSASIVDGADGGRQFVLDATGTGSAGTTIGATPPDGAALASTANTVGATSEGPEPNLVGMGTNDATRDIGDLRENLDEFVTQYNALRAQLSEFATGHLQGERLPRDAELRLRSVFSLPVSAHSERPITPLEMGFTFDRYGVLSIDEARLLRALQSDPDRFVDSLTRTGDGLVAALDEFTGAGGVIGNREDSIRLEQAETHYRRQFTLMDRLVGDLQSTSADLTQRLEA